MPKGAWLVVFYPRLRDLREDHDLTQEQLVTLLQIHKTTYVNYEQGKREIPFALVIRLAKLYNVSIDYIAGLSSHAKPLELTAKKRSLSFPESRSANEYE